MAREGGHAMVRVVNRGTLYKEARYREARYREAPWVFTIQSH